MKRRDFFKTVGSTTRGTAMAGNYLRANDLSVFVDNKTFNSKRLDSLHKRVSGPPPNELSLDYARILTASLNKNDQLTMIIRRAQAFFDVCDNIPIEIGTGELIVGGITDKPRVGYFAPECWVKWKKGKNQHIPGKEVIASSHRYHDMMKFAFTIPEEIENYWMDKEPGGKVGHFVADYGKVLRLGYSGIIREIEARIIEHKENSTLDESKHNFFKAAIISCKAAIRYSQRYAHMAAELAEYEKAPERKRELLHIAKICLRIPEKPATTFHEATQAFWLTHVLLHIHSSDWSISPGRFDQFMYPYYKSDIENGRINEAAVEELMSCLWIKFNEIRVDIELFTYQNLLIGGTDKYGNDATNDITWMCLKTQLRMGGAQPSLSMRWHSNTPEDLLVYASKVLVSGCGRPAMFNDDVIIPALLRLNVPLAEARDYAIAGCEEITLPGTVYGIALAAHINNASCLIKALEAMDYSFSNSEEILAAYKKQLSERMKQHFNNVYKNDERKARNTPHPFSSQLFDDCIQNGKDLTVGGARYNWVSVAEAGTITVAESIYAIEKGVFENQIFTMQEMKMALENDFEGYEYIQAYCKNKVPKFGNDISEIDDFVKEMAMLNHDVITELDMKNFMGGEHIIGAGAAFAWILGSWTGATPDGRNAKSSLSLSYGPTNGADITGPTAMLNSVSKLDWEYQPGGALTHLRLPFSGYANINKPKELSTLLETFFDKDGIGVQTSVVDTKVLKSAMADPTNHIDVMVRIGGFTAQFAMLSEYIQKEFIQRSEHNYA